MSIRVLIVDDSRFIRNRTREILQEEAGFEVVGAASNGMQAFQMTQELMPDVVIMSAGIPLMNGHSAVKKIMKECPTAILMFSENSDHEVHATFSALNAGAIDFLPKQLNQIDDNRETAKRHLRQRVRIVALQTSFNRNKTKQHKPQIINRLAKKFTSFIGAQAKNRKFELLVIVASTGGPVAIQLLLAQISANCSFPIIIVQHMPKEFTSDFAERLNKVSKLTVKEASDGEVLKSGVVLLAPGGKQMEINSKGNKKTVSIRNKHKNEIYSPSADITLSSIPNSYSTDVLTIVLSGIGSDGKKGAKNLKQKGFSIWAQDEASCSIYGMSKAIVEAELADKVVSLDEIANELKQLG